MTLLRNLRRSAVRWNAVFALALITALFAQGLQIVDALRGPEPVSTAFEEDAYYSFSVARNVAAGDGVTSAHGEPTSGVQPLWTLLLVPVFALLGDGRAALASIFLLSAAIWLAAAWLFAALINRSTASSEASAGLAGLLCLIAFLSDVRLQGYFFNGLETGLYAMCLLLLWLCLDIGRPFHSQASWQRSCAFGLLLGTLLLVRNDAVLIVPFVLLSAAAAHRDRRALQRIVLAALVAAAIISPWLVYNYELTGSLLPQSGRATGVNPHERVLSWRRLSTATRVVLELAAPPVVPAATRLPSWCLAAYAIVLCAGLTRLYRRDSEVRRMARLSACLAAGSIALVVYYALFSRATWMYPRYFMPVRLLAIAAWMWLVLDVLRAFRTWRAVLVAALMLAAAATSMVHAVRWFGSQAPFMGNDLRLIMAEGLCGGPTRVGMFDSGRIGYRCAPYIVNLDGKASLAALNAVKSRRVLEYLSMSGIDRLFLRDGAVRWFDRTDQRWRRQFSQESAAPGRAIFVRVVEPDGADR